MRYMLITFFRQKGGQIDEQVAVAKKLKPADNQTSNIIIDYKERKIIKCIIEGNIIDTDYDRMVAYYRRVYPVLVEQLEREHAPPEPAPEPNESSVKT